MEMRSLVHVAAARQLGQPLTAAVTVKPPGWYKQEKWSPDADSARRRKGGAREGRTA